MNKKRVIFALILGFLSFLVITIIFPFLYDIFYFYLMFILIYFGIIVKNIEKFGKLAISIMIVSAILYFITLNLEIIDNIKVIFQVISDAGMLFFFVYLLIILPKYSSRFHMGMEDSGVGKYHLHEGFIGLVLYIISSIIMFIPVIITYFTPWTSSISHIICLAIGGGGNILSTFFIGRDWNDIRHGLLIEKIKEGGQREEHEDFWKSPAPLLKKYTKLNDFTTGFIFCGISAGLYYSPLFNFDYFKLIITVLALGLITFGGFLIGRSWIDMLYDRFGETINRSLLLDLKSTLPPQMKIESVDTIQYPIWIVNGLVEIKKRKWLFFKKKIDIKKTILIDDMSGKFLYLKDSIIERFPEYMEDSEDVKIYIEGSSDIQRKLSIDQIKKAINFLNNISVKPGNLPLYAVKLKNEKDDTEEFLGIHIKTGHRIKLFQDYSVNYLMPFKEEEKMVKDIMLRVSIYLKRIFARKKSK
ncbi:MAG: hypothetical protein ACTSXT_15290 [Candidatus Helarchaeota archaeon]